MGETRSERIALEITPTLFKELEKLTISIGKRPSRLVIVYLGEA